MSKPKYGKVWLVGAGPGDVELLTLKAVRALGEADVVLIDDLVEREILQYAKPTVHVIEVGKRGGCRSTPQAFIERKMVQLASAGLTVARVKGGDPYMFGRGGEEVSMLAVHGIACEVVPGISSGMAAPAAVGVPVTHRDASHGVAFVTGHPREGEAVDWAALAKSGLTLVIYMGVARCESIVAALTAGGLSADTPACAIENATRHNQRSINARLGSLAQAIRGHDIGSPAILVIGKVAAYARASTLEAAMRTAAA